MSRPASVHGAELTAAEQAMWDRLEFVKMKDLQDAMVKANIPNAGATVWKVDLITLAIQHEYNHIIPRMRLFKPVQPKVPVQPPSSFAAIPMQPPLPVVAAGLIPGPPLPIALLPVVAAGLIPGPPPPTAPTAKPKRPRAVEAQNTAIRVESPAISELLVGDTMGVAGRLAKLYEAKWTQSFLPISLSRGFKFAGEFTCEEVRVEIQKMALESGCNFWKTDSSKIESLDGYVQSMTFKCPHFTIRNTTLKKKVEGQQKIRMNYGEMNLGKDTT